MPLNLSICPSIVFPPLFEVRKGEEKGWREGKEGGYDCTVCLVLTGNAYLKPNFDQLYDFFYLI